MNEWIVLFLAILAIAIWLIIRNKSNAAEYICTRCGWKGRPKKGLNGNAAVELLLWLLFIVPGIIYTIYRGNNRPLICRECGATEMVPLDSPRGRELLSHYHPNEASRSTS